MTADDELQLLPPIESSCGWAPAVFLCERRSDPPGLLLGRLDIGTSLLKGHTLSRHYHSLQLLGELHLSEQLRNLLSPGCLQGLPFSLASGPQLLLSCPGQSLADWC